jgi:hypothetical protein
MSTKIKRVHGNNTPASKLLRVGSAVSSISHPKMEITDPMMMETWYLSKADPNYSLFQLMVPTFVSIIVIPTRKLLGVQKQPASYSRREQELILIHIQAVGVQEYFNTM